MEDGYHGVSLVQTNGFQVDTVSPNGQLTTGVVMHSLGKLKSFLVSATVEPVMVAHMSAAMIVQVVWQSFLLNLVCMEYACQNATLAGQSITTAICHKLRTTIEDDELDNAEALIQSDVANIQAWRSAVEYSILVPIVLLLGAWSDGSGTSPVHRRAVMLLSLFGRFLQATLLFIFSTVYQHGEATLESITLMKPSTLAALMMALPVALTGSCTAFDAAAYAHVACQVTPQHHTFRLGLANGFWCVGTVLGLMISGFSYKVFGFPGAFGIAAILEVLAAGLTLWLVSEKKNSQTAIDSTKTFGFIGTLFNPWEMIQPFKVTFRQRPDSNRKLIFLMLLCLTLSFGASCGRQSVLFLYTRYRFQWDEVEYGLYGMYLMILEVIGSFVAMGLCSYHWKISDPIIGAMSCTSHLLSSTLYLFVNTGWHMYIAPLVEMANGPVVVIPRAIITKLVEKKEQGRVNSLLGCMEALIPLIFEPIYNLLYSETLASSFPQAFFLLSAILVLPPTVFFICIHMRNQALLRRGEVRDGTDLPLNSI